jgi:hypothetical protein
MWLLPSYNRPELLKQTLAHCAATGMTTPGVILVNGGDHKPYKSIPLPPNWRIIFRSENLGWAQGCQHLFERFPDEPWYGFFYDDMVPKTPEWDRRLLERMKPGGIVTAENNWHKPARIQTAVLDGNLVREVGFITVPKTWSCFTDDFWETLGSTLGLWRHADDVIVETLNPRKGDMPMDEATTVAGYGPNNEKLEADRKTFEAFITNDLPPIARRVRDRFGKKASFRDVRLLIGSPSVDSTYCAAYVKSMVETITLLNQLGIGYAFCCYDRCSMVHYVRSRTVAYMLKKTTATHLLFIDADMGWPAHAIPELLAHRKDVIAAVGCTKEIPHRFCVHVDPELMARRQAFDPETGLMRVKGAGTGFMLISRECLQRHWDASPDHPFWTPPEEPELGPIRRVFDFDYANPEGWGEDYSFCTRERKMGGDIWIDPTIQLQHCGPHNFTGSYADWMRAQAAVNPLPMAAE